MYSYGSPHTAAQKQDDQHERTFSSYVRIQVVILKTYLGRWTIGRSGERGSGISVLPARYDDDDIISNQWKLSYFKMSQNIYIHSTFVPTHSYIYIMPICTHTQMDIVTPLSICFIKSKYVYQGRLLASLEAMLMQDVTNHTEFKFSTFKRKKKLFWLK